MGSDQANGIAVSSPAALSRRAESATAFSGPPDKSAPTISEESFVALTVRYERRIRTFVATLHPNPSDIDEILQNAWLVAWKKLNTFCYTAAEPDEEFVRWLCTRSLATKF